MAQYNSFPTTVKISNRYFQKDIECEIKRKEYAMSLIITKIYNKNNECGVALNMLLH